MNRQEAIALTDKLGRNNYGFCKIGWANRENREIALGSGYFVIDLRTSKLIVSPKEDEIMSNQKEMTKAEIQDALECFVRADREASSIACENCSYIDFCHDLQEVIDRKPKKYV